MSSLPRCSRVIVHLFSRWLLQHFHVTHTCLFLFRSLCLSVIFRHMFYAVFNLLFCQHTNLFVLFAFFWNLNKMRSVLQGCHCSLFLTTQGFPTEKKNPKPTVDIRSPAKQLFFSFGLWIFFFFFFTVNIQRGV